MYQQHFFNCITDDQSGVYDEETTEAQGITAI